MACRGRRFHGVDADERYAAGDEGIKGRGEIRTSHETARGHAGTVTKCSKYLVQRVATNTVDGAVPEFTSQDTLWSIAHLRATNDARRASINEPLRFAQSSS